MRAATWEPVWQAAQGTSSLGPAQSNRGPNLINKLLGHQDGMVGIEAPQPAVVNLHGAEFGKPRESPLPTNPRCRVSGAVPPEWGDAAGVPKRGGGQVAHGVIGSREDVAPQKLTLSQCLVELGVLVLCDGCREGGDKA